MKKIIVFAILIVTALCCSSCSAPPRTVPIETIKQVTKTDTLFLNSFCFNSTYISHNLLTDRSRDTVLIKKTNTEIRYQIFIDTIERVKIEIQRDSIPYEVRIATIKDVPRKSTPFDIICYCSFAILLTLLIGATILMVIPMIKK